MESIEPTSLIYRVSIGNIVECHSRNKLHKFRFQTTKLTLVPLQGTLSYRAATIVLLKVQLNVSVVVTCHKVGHKNK